MNAAALEKPTSARNRLTAAETRVQGLEYVSRSMAYDVERGRTPADLLNPDYWVNIARKLRSKTTILCQAEDNSFVGLLFVFSASDTWAKVDFVWLKQYDAPVNGSEVPEHDLYKIDSISTGWRVILKANGKVMADGLVHRADAERFIDEQVAAKKK